MAESLGTIYYDVDANLEPLLGKMRQAESALGGLGKEMGKADQSAGRLDAQMTKTAVAVDKATRSASGAQSAFGGLYKVLAAYIGLQTFETLIALSDEYGQMASRVRQVTKDTAEYEMVQARLLKTANATYRPLAEAQEVFIRTADSIRDLGYTTEQALDITDSFSFLLVTNAASADRASSAISAYSQSIQTGKVSSDQWQSILAAMPTIVDGISSATGRSREEIKKLGVEGRLSLEALNEGLRRSRDENEALAEEMETSVQDAFTALRNSLQVFVGKVNESSGATGILTSAVGELADVLQDPDTIKAAQDLAAGVVSALNTIVETMRETVGVVKWGAAEIAARLHGAASDDIVRLEQQAQQLRDLQKRVRFNPLARLRLTGEGVEWFDDAEIASRLKGTEALIQEFYDRQNKRPPIKINIEEPPKPVGAESGTPPVSATGGDGNKHLQRMRDELELAKLTGEARAKLQAIQKLGADATAEEREEAERLAVEIYRLEEAQKKLKSSRKKLTDEEKEARKVKREIVQAEKENTEALQRLTNEVRLAKLSGDELAATAAELKLNEYATPEQIEQARALGVELGKLEAAEKKRKAFGTGKSSVLKHIKGDVSPLSGGQFDNQQERYEAERKAEAERYAEQQKRLTEALELQLVTKEEYQQLELEMYRVHSDRLAQIDQARIDMMVSQSAAAFGQMASDIEAFAKVFGAENSKMMAIAKTAAIAQTIMQTYEGAQKAFTALAGIPIVGPALGTAAAAAAVAGGMARVAQIRGVSGRLAGGPVSAGKMYRVNENGAPEVFSAANGQQFLIPNQRGEVISNRDATAGGGGVVINIHNAPQGTVAESSKGQDGQQIIDIWVADFMSDGRTASAVQGKFGLSPQGR